MVTNANKKKKRYLSTEEVIEWIFVNNESKYE